MIIITMFFLCTHVYNINFPTHEHSFMVFFKPKDSVVVCSHQSIGEICVAN